MICAKPGSALPSLLAGEEVYVLVDGHGEPIAVGLSYPAVVAAIGTYSPDEQRGMDVKTVRWIG